jgi:outer membrane lipopolysaccharide assembly protein LptE/RlpB
LILKEKNIWIVFLCLLSLFFSACGYRFTGGGNLPQGIQTVYITMLENRTSETGAENIFTNDLIYEFTKNNEVASKDQADAYLSGIIKSMSIETISHRGTYTSLERRVKIALDLKLTDTDGKVIWIAKDISENEEYDVMSDKLATEQKRRDAILALSKRLAEKVHNRLTEGF